MWSPQGGLEGAMSTLDGCSGRKPLGFGANERLSFKAGARVDHFFVIYLKQEKSKEEY